MNSLRTGRAQLWTQNTARTSGLQPRIKCPIPCGGTLLDTNKMCSEVFVGLHRTPLCNERRSYGALTIVCETHQLQKGERWVYEQSAHRQGSTLANKYCTRLKPVGWYRDLPDYNPNLRWGICWPEAMYNYT